MDLFGTPQISDIVDMFRTMDVSDFFPKCAFPQYV
jgi:hypothetical protein